MHYKFYSYFLLITILFIYFIYYFLEDVKIFMILFNSFDVEVAKNTLVE